MKNIFEAVPEQLKDELVEPLVERGSVRIERIISRGHASPASGWYDQQHSEWVIVLRGKAVLVFEDGRSLALEQGDHLNIPAHSKHRVEWTAPEVETVWLAVHYP